MAKSSASSATPSQTHDRSNLRQRRTNTASTLSRPPTNLSNSNQENTVLPQHSAGCLNDIRPRRERTRQDDYLYYSLAGPPAPPPRYDQHQTYFDPGYLESNPWMQQEDDGPNFTLAKNFPRTVRWKRKKDRGQEGRKNVEAIQKGESEAAPQVEAAEEFGDEVEHGEEERDSIDLADTVEEEEQAKARRRNRQQQLQQQSVENEGLTRHGTADSFEPPKPTEQERNPQKPFNVWAVMRLKAQRPLGELLGVVVYSFIGISANLAVVTSQNEAGTLTTGYWAWGFATMIDNRKMSEESQAFKSLLEKVRRARENEQRVRRTAEQAHENERPTRAK